MRKGKNIIILTFINEFENNLIFLFLFYIPK